jgi:hypothetical protein
MAAHRSRKKVVFLTADQLEEQADRRANEAEQLPEGEARQKAIHTAAQLKVYASMKRALAPQPPNRNSGRGSEIGTGDSTMSDHAACIGAAA